LKIGGAKGLPLRAAEGRLRCLLHPQAALRLPAVMKIFLFGKSANFKIAPQKKI
jgi:hypothetical protein